MRIRHLFTLLLVALCSLWASPASAEVRVLLNGVEEASYSDLRTALTKFFSSYTVSSDDTVEFISDAGNENFKMSSKLTKPANIIISAVRISCDDVDVFDLRNEGVKLTLNIAETLEGNIQMRRNTELTFLNVNSYSGHCETESGCVVNVEGGDFFCDSGTLFNNYDSHVNINGGTFHLQGTHCRIYEGSDADLTIADGYALYCEETGERILPGAGRSLYAEEITVSLLKNADLVKASFNGKEYFFSSVEKSLTAMLYADVMNFDLTLLKDASASVQGSEGDPLLFFVENEVTFDLQNYTLTVDAPEGPVILARNSDITLKAKAGGGIVNTSGSMMESYGGSLTVGGGTYKAAQSGFYAEETKVRIEDGEFEAARVAFDYRECNDVEVSSGHFLSTGTDFTDGDDYHWPAVKSNGNSLPEGYIFVGHFPEGDVQRSDMYGYLYLEGKCFYDVSVGIGDPLATVTIGSTVKEYASLSAAFKAAQQANEAIVTLLKDTELQNTITLTTGDVTFKLEDYRLETYAPDAAFIVNGGTLRMKAFENGRISSRYFDSTIFDCRSGLLVISSGNYSSYSECVICKNGSNVIITDGFFTSQNSAVLRNEGFNTILMGGDFATSAEDTSVGAFQLKTAVEVPSDYTFVTHESAGNFQVRTTSGMRSVWSDVSRRPAVDVSVEKFVNYATLITPDGKETDYMYFEEAMDAAQQMEKATVRLNANVAFCDGSLYRSYVINSGDITLDCDNHILLSASRYALDLRGGKLTIEGSPFGGVYQLSGEEFGSSINQCAIYLKSADGASNSSRPQLVINSGYFRFPAMGIISFDGGVEVNGGTFEGGGSYFFMYHGKDLVLKGGTFKDSDSPIACYDQGFWIPEGYEVIDLATGDKIGHHDMGFIVPYPYNVTIIKPEPVVEVATAEGTVGFTDFYEAYKYAENQSAAEITLLKDITLKTPIQQEDGNIVLNLGDYTITYIDGAGRYNRVFSINWGSLTVNASPQGGIRSDFGNIFTIYYSRSLTINGGYYEASDIVVYGSGGTSLNITDGTFVSTNNSAILLDYSEKHNLSGGHYISPEGQPAVDGRGRDLARGYAYYNASITPYMEMQTGSAMSPRTKDFEFPNDIVVMPCLVKATLDRLDGSEPVEYYNMHDAITDARDTDREVKLVNDMVLTTALYPNRGDIRFDLNGHTIMCYDGGVLLPGKGTITICGNGTIVCPDAYGIFYLTEEEMDEDAPGTIIVEDGTYIGRQFLYADMGNFVFKGGTFVGEIGMQCYDDAQVEMRGGTLIASDYPLLNGNDQELLPAGYQFYNASNQPLIYSRAQNKLKEEDMSDAHYVTVHQPGAPVAGTISALSHVIESAKQGLVKLDTINALVNAALGR